MESVFFFQTNITLINGKPVVEPVIVEHKDMLTIVDRSFRFLCWHVFKHKCKIAVPWILVQGILQVWVSGNPTESCKNSSKIIH